MTRNGQEENDMRRLALAVYEAERNILNILPVCFTDKDLDDYFHSGQVITVVVGLTKKENRVIHRIAARILAEGGILQRHGGYYIKASLLC